MPNLSDLVKDLHMHIASMRGDHQFAIDLWTRRLIERHETQARNARAGRVFAWSAAVLWVVVCFGLWHAIFGAAFMMVFASLATGVTIVFKGPCKRWDEQAIEEALEQLAEAHARSNEAQL